MSVAVGPKPVPSVPVQVLRAALGTLTVAALVAGLVWGWGYAGPWASDRWARAFGDPSLRLAEGATLPATTARTVVLGWSSTSLRGANDIELVSRALGGPVEQLRTPGAVAEAIGQGWKASDATSAPGTTWLRTASGVATWWHAPLDQNRPWMIDSPLVVVHGTGGLVAATAAERAALLRRWADVLGATSGAPAGALRIDVTEKAERGRIQVDAVWQLASSRPAAPSQLYSQHVAGATFDRSGRLVQAMIETRVVTSVRPVAVQSASAAWDDLRHHRIDGDWPTQVAGDGWAPVSSAQLVPGTEERDPFSGASYSSEPSWVFLDQYDGVQVSQNAAEVAG